MGEEKKIPEGEKKAEEQSKNVPEEAEKKQQDNPPPPPPPTEDNPKSAGDKNCEESKADAPPLPQPEIVMRVYMHCEGCARKVRRCLKGFHGVEEVITDCKSHRVVVKGEKADPTKVLDRVQRKTHRHVELLWPIPPPSPPPEEKKAEDKESPKPEDTKDEPKVVTVVLKVHMHCEACSLEIKRRIERMKEVEEATPDLKNSLVSVKGTFDPQKLVEYVYKRTGKHAIIVKQDTPPESKEEGKGKDGKEEVKDEGGLDEGKIKDKDPKGGEEGNGDKPEGGGDAGKEGGPTGGVVAGDGDEAWKGEFMRNEYNYYYSPPRYAMEMHPYGPYGSPYPPQIFSDENPNACSIM